jgi:MFS family permease
VPVALAFAVLDVTGSASALGLVLVARTLPMAGLMLVGGVWGDRMTRSRLMVASHLVRAVSQGLLAGLLVTGEARLWSIALLQAVHGVGTAFYRPAASGLVPETVRADRLQPANALMGLTSSSANVLGPALAAALLAVTAPGWVLLLDAATFLVAAVLLVGVRVPARAVRYAGFLPALREGWSELRSRTWLWASIVVFAMFQLCVLATFSVLGPLIAKRSLGGASTWALVVAAFGLGFVVGGVLALRVRPRRPLLVNALFLGASVPSLILLAFAVPAPFLAASELVAGAALGFADTLWETTLQQEVPPHARSRVASYDWFGSTALRPLGLAIAGPIAAAVGAKATLIGAAAMLAASVAWLLSIPGVRGLRSTAGGPRSADPLGV